MTVDTATDTRECSLLTGYIMPNTVTSMFKLVGYDYDPRGCASDQWDPMNNLAEGSRAKIETM